MAPLTRHEQDTLLALQAQALALNNIDDHLLVINGVLTKIASCVDEGQLRVVIDAGKLTVRTDG